MIIENGIYNVYKPYGWTSFDVVNKLRRISGIKKIGHAGTLDPMAEGVLVVAVGRENTKQIDNIMVSSKKYLASIMLGIETDTYDLEGRIIEMKSPENLKVEEIRNTALEFRGKIMQTPPIYSALKVKGKKLYEYARKGQTVEIAPREVEIKDLQVLAIEMGRYPILKLSIEVSKGTYVRSLAYDIGKRLGVSGVLCKLVRSFVGDYCIEDSIRIEEFQKAEGVGDIK